MGFYFDALAFVGEGIASGALGEIGSEGIGWLLRQIFGDPPPSDLPEIEAIGKQLNTIQDTLYTMEAMISTDFEQIEQQLQAIAQQQLYEIWQEKDQALQAYITTIDTQYTLYVEYAQNAGTTTKQNISDLVTDIQSSTGALDCLAQINALVLGSGEDKGVLQLWREMVAPLMTMPPFLRDKMLFGQTAEQYLNYYTRIAWAQMRAANLLVEAYNQQGNHGEVTTQWQDFKSFMGRQEIPFLVQFEWLLYGVAQQNATWFGLETSPSGTFCSLSYDCASVFQDIFAGGLYYSYYQPTPARAIAEQLLATAYAMGPSERRIAVWMIHPAGIRYPTNLDLTQANVQLVPASGGAPISPDSAATLINTTLSLPMPFYSAIQLLNARLVRRYVFDQSVSDGTYTLYDENNTFPTVSGNNQLTDYFQDGQYLNYILRVDAGQPSDFMDFGTYIDPQGTFVVASAYTQESSASQRGAA